LGSGLAETSAAGMAMVYDEAGNLVELKVQRSGACALLLVHAARDLTP